MDDPTNVKPATVTSDADNSEDCTFCRIIKSYPPVSPFHASIETTLNPDKLSPPAYILLSTEDVVAFLDIAPLTRGHVLVAPRKHRVRIGNLTPAEMAQIGSVLPLLARSVLKAVLPDIPHDEADYNVVQNNGPGAAQVIPHVHFHIVPRPPLNYQPPSSAATESAVGSGRSKYGASKLPTGIQASYIQFGRGMRNELDDDDAAMLIKDIRLNIASDWQKQFVRSNRKSPEKL